MPATSSAAAPSGAEKAEAEGYNSFYDAAGYAILSRAGEEVTGEDSSMESEREDGQTHTRILEAGGVARGAAPAGKPCTDEQEPVRVLRQGFEDDDDVVRKDVRERRGQNNKGRRTPTESRLAAKRSGPGDRANSNDHDCIYKHPQTGAAVYIGNAAAAKSTAYHERANIRGIVNCCDMKPSSKLENYFRFDISDFHKSSNKLIESATKGDGEDMFLFFHDMFAFVDARLADGDSVLIHCVAGAHRAGSAGVAYRMWRLSQEGSLPSDTDLPFGFEKTLTYVQQRRPIVDPFHCKPSKKGRETQHVLADLLKALELALPKFKDFLPNEQTQES